MNSTDLEFDPSTHTYRAGGEVLISVTQALKSAGVIDYSMIPQDVLQLAARRGTLVHRAIHYWLDGDLDESTVSEEHRGYVDAAKRFVEESQFVPMRVECRGFHPTLRYAGTFDLDGLIGGSGGDLATVDWKTGMICEGHAIQLSAYNNLRSNPRVARRLAVKLNSDGTYRVHEYPSSQHPENTFSKDIAIFQSALTCAKWNEARNGGLKNI